jgi:hypothetical protein
VRGLNDLPAHLTVIDTLLGGQAGVAARFIVAGSGWPWWDGRDAEVDGGAGAPVELGELVVGAGEADLEAFDLAEPAFAFGLGDAGDQVVADLGQAGPLGRVWPEHRAADAGVLMDAGRSERAGAGADGDLALLEVSLHQARRHAAAAVPLQ